MIDIGQALFNYVYDCNGTDFYCASGMYLYNVFTVCCFLFR